MAIERLLIDQVFEYGLESKLRDLIVPRLFHYEDGVRVRDMDIYSRPLAHSALDHLSFIIKFGHHEEKKRIYVGEDDVEANYPDEFEAWIFAGCPGLSLIQLEQLIHEFAQKTET